MACVHSIVIILVFSFAFAQIDVCFTNNLWCKKTRPNIPWAGPPAGTVKIRYSDIPDSEYKQIWSVEGVVIPAKGVSATRGEPPNPANGGPWGGDSGNDRGHLMALQLGGPDISMNIVPQPSDWQERGQWRQQIENVVLNYALDQYGWKEGKTVQAISRMTEVPKVGGESACSVVFSVEVLGYDDTDKQPTGYKGSVRCGKDVYSFTIKPNEDAIWQKKPPISLRWNVGIRLLEVKNVIILATYWLSYPTLLSYRCFDKSTYFPKDTEKDKIAEILWSLLIQNHPGTHDKILELLQKKNDKMRAFVMKTLDETMIFERNMGDDKHVTVFAICHCLRNGNVMKPFIWITDKDKNKCIIYQPNQKSPIFSTTTTLAYGKDCKSQISCFSFNQRDASSADMDIDGGDACQLDGDSSSVDGEPIDAEDVPKDVCPDPYAEDIESNKKKKVAEEEDE